MTGLLSQVLSELSSSSAWLLAAEGNSGEIGASMIAQNAVSAILFAIIGLIILTLSIVLMSRLMPLPFWKEIEEDQNIALGIMVGSIVIGISIIIAAAIHG